MLDFDKTTQKIKEMVEENNHTEAYIEICKLIGSKANTLKAELEEILAYREKHDGLSGEMYFKSADLRSQVKEMMLNTLGQQGKELLKAL